MRCLDRLNPQPEAVAGEGLLLWGLEIEITGVDWSRGKFKFGDEYDVMRQGATKPCNERCLVGMQPFT